jgi:hypothetical protein
LLTPLPVQRAVRDGRLPMVLGEKVEGLPEDQKDLIAQRITAGEDPRAVVQSYYATSGRRRRAILGVGDLMRSLQKAQANLDGRIKEIRPHNLVHNLPLLSAGKRLIEELIAQAGE